MQLNTEVPVPLTVDQDCSYLSYHNFHSSLNWENMAQGAEITRSLAWQSSQIQLD